MIPRIQGKVGRADMPEDPKIHNKWFFEIWMTDLGQTIEPMSFGKFGPWETEDVAYEELQKAARLACSAVEGSMPDEFIDMKAGGVTRRWDKIDKN